LPQVEKSLHKAQRALLALITSTESQDFSALSRSGAASEIDWERIENFVGYGSIDAQVVFIGIEEGLVDAGALRNDLLWRSTFGEVMNLEEAHRGLAHGTKLFGNRPRSQPTWDAISDLMLRFNRAAAISQKQWLEKRIVYRTHELGQSGSSTLLMELLPLPNQNASSWPYGALFPDRKECASRTAYLKKVLPLRLKALSEALSQHKRKAIICYGRGGWLASGVPSRYGGWLTFKQLFPGIAWASFEGLRKYEIATWHGAKVTLAYHLSRWFRSKTQLDELASIALP
jgi:hypothetical protein